MKQIPSLLLLTLLVGLAPDVTHASAREITVRDGAAVEVTVSARELTRITLVDGSRLARLWGVEGTMEVQPDTDAGEAYIRPIGISPGGSFSFFVRDEHGGTYTLTARVSDVPAQTVRLRPARRQTDSAGRTGFGPAERHVARIKHLMRALAAGRLPDGYTAERVGQQVPIWVETEIEIVQRWHGEHLNGEIWTLRNLTDREMTLDESEFRLAYPDVRSIGIRRPMLGPGESTEIYFARGG